VATASSGSRSSNPAEHSADRDLAAQSGAIAPEGSTAGKLTVAKAPDDCVNNSDQPAGETASTEMRDQTPLQLPADTSCHRKLPANSLTTDDALEKKEMDGEEMPVGQEQSDEWPAVLEVASDDHGDNPTNKAYQQESDDGQPHQDDWQSRDKPVRLKNRIIIQVFSWSGSPDCEQQPGYAQQYNQHPHSHTIPVLEQSDELPAVMEVAHDDPGDTPTHKV
jgi:hypothetical protein